MLRDYRNAVAGAFITIATWAASTWAGVDIPDFVGAAAVTVVVFALGFLPKPSSEVPETPDGGTSK